MLSVFSRDDDDVIFFLLLEGEGRTETGHIVVSGFAKKKTRKMFND